MEKRDVQLEGMNVKQRKKEYRTKNKEIRSKDELIRQAALEQIFNEPLYLLEGECIIPFLETITPAKVNTI
jgi:hypothetical protein